MNLKGVLFSVLVSSLLIGSVCAASVNDFKVDSTFNGIYNGEYYSVYANGNQDADVCIYKNVNDDVYDDMENDDVLDHVIHHDGREYTYGDDDMALTKNADNTASFTDYDHATHGVSEVVSQGGEQYIVAFWAKDTSSMDNAKLVSMMNDFNKNNNVSPVAF